MEEAAVPSRVCATATGRRRSICANGQRAGPSVARMRCLLARRPRKFARAAAAPRCQPGCVASGSRGIVYLQNEYDLNGRVIKQTQADGSPIQLCLHHQLRRCRRSDQRHRPARHGAPRDLHLDGLLDDGYAGARPARAGERSRSSGSRPLTTWRGGGRRWPGRGRATVWERSRPNRGTDRRQAYADLDRTSPVPPSAGVPEPAGRRR